MFVLFPFPLCISWGLRLVFVCVWMLKVLVITLEEMIIWPGPGSLSFFACMTGALRVRFIKILSVCIWGSIFFSLLVWVFFFTCLFRLFNIYIMQALGSLYVKREISHAKQSFRASIHIWCIKYVLFHSFTV